MHMVSDLHLCTPPTPPPLPLRSAHAAVRCACAATEINALIADSHRATIISIGSITTMVIYAGECSNGRLGLRPMPRLSDGRSLRRTVGNATLQASVNTHGYDHVTYGSVLGAHFGLAALMLAAVEVGAFAGFDAPTKKAKAK